MRLTARVVAMPAGAHAHAGTAQTGKTLAASEFERKSHDSMAMNARMQAELAARIRLAENPEWMRFAIEWMAFNTLYKCVQARSERHQVAEVVRQFLHERSASGVLESVRPQIDFLYALPPGNSRLSDNDPKFRQKTVAAMAVVKDKGAPAIERVASLMTVVYQVRCNLLHGSKDPNLKRDMDLVEASNLILKAVLSELINLMAPSRNTDLTVLHGSHEARQL